MAIKAIVELATGEEKELYIRINNTEVSNHGVKAMALVRGYISKDAYLSGKNYAHEENVEVDIDVSLPVWDQIYNKLKENHSDAKDC